MSKEFQYSECKTAPDGTHYLKSFVKFPALKCSRIGPDRPVSRVSWRPDKATKSYALTIGVGRTSSSLPFNNAQLQVDVPGKRTQCYLVESIPGDCGSPVIGDAGIVGVHTGNLADQNAFCTIYSNAEHAAKAENRPVGRPDGLVRNHQNESARLVRAKPSAKPAPTSRGTAREAALTDVSAPGSDYLGPRKDTGGSVIQRYIQMVTNPWSGAMVRLPDINITPTCLAKFYANRTFSVPNAPSDYYITFGINSRLGNYNKTAPLDIASLYAPGGVPAVAYDYAPGTILAPQFMTPANALVPLADYPGPATTVGPWSDDFGLEQTTTTSWISSYRTLAMAVRVRIVGLPSGTFMAPGKIYFAQVRNDATDLPVSEQDYVVLERLGRATHVSMDAVRESGSKTFFAVPDSADKMNLSSAFYQAPGLFPLSTPVTANGLRRFPGYSAPGVNGERMIMPYDSITDRTAASTATSIDAAVADQTMHIMCGVFGAQTSEGIPGLTLEVDYALVAEYIPSSLAPPGLETVVQLPSSAALDSIFAACAVATEVRPVLLQAPGDLTISSPTPSTTPAQAERARGVQRRLGAFTERITGSAVPHGRREGWFDWLGDVDVNIGGWHLGNAAARAKKGKKT